MAVREARKAIVLLAEDEPGVRELSVQMLERAGFEVLVAENGVEAVELASRMDVELDVLVFDVVMPRMNGREAATQIRKVRPELRVVFTSGYSGRELESGDAMLPGDVFLPKPYGPGELLRAVAAALNREDVTDGAS